ncbi:MAG: class I SAM-dependent methyltransferase [Gammaproteobacteria bacterium]
MRDKPTLIKHSWRANALAWIDAVRGGLIESRRLATDEAIVHAALALNPNRVLDMGCGEGWLCRALADCGVSAVGIDSAPELITAARHAGGGEFHVAAYEELAGLRRSLGLFPVVICNFSLFEEDLRPVLAHLQALLEPGGRLLIHTLHPWRGAAGDYRDGWRVETFAGCGGRFSQVMPWYFRGLTSWSALLANNGFCVESLVEPSDPNSGTPLSLLLRCRSLPS